MWAAVEYFDGGIIRVFNDARKYGEPYSYCVAFKNVSEGLIEFVGATQAPTPSQWRAIMTALRKQGIRGLIRRRGGAAPGVRILK
jgi:hypothetical protein